MFSFLKNNLFFFLFLLILKSRNSFFKRFIFAYEILLPPSVESNIRQQDQTILVDGRIEPYLLSFIL
jgi:hypothetical protein